MEKKLKTYAAGLPGFGSVGPKGPTGKNGLSTYFTDFDGLNGTDEFILRKRILENLSLIRSNYDNIPGYKEGRIYQEGDYIIDKNSNVYVITLDNYVYKWLGFNYSVPNIFYTNDEINNFGYTKYFNLYYGDDKFLVDSIYTDSFFDRKIYDNTIYETPVGDFNTVNYVNLKNNIVTSTGNNLQPFVVFTADNSYNSNSLHSFAIVKEDKKTGTLFRIGNLDNDFNVRNVNLSLDFKNIYLPNNTYINNNKVLSTNEINLNILEEDNFIHDPESFYIKSKTDIQEDNKFSFDIFWDIKDFFIKNESINMESVSASLHIYKKFSENIEDNTINLGTYTDNNITIYNIPITPVSIESGLNVVVPKEDDNDEWYVHISITDNSTGWSRMSSIREVLAYSTDVKLHIVNSKYESVKIKTVFRNSNGNIISNNIQQVTLPRCSETGTNIKDIDNILLNLSSITDDKVFVEFNVNDIILTQELNETFLNEEDKYITLDLLSVKQIEANENKETYIVSIDKEDFSKKADIDSYDRILKVRVLNKTNLNINQKNLLKRNVNDNIIDKINGVEIIGEDINNLIKPFKYVEVELKHNFAKNNTISIIPQELAFNLDFKLNNKIKLSDSFAFEARQNRNPITYDYGQKKFNITTEQLNDINNSLKYNSSFLYKSFFRWHHDNRWDARYLKSQEILRADLIFEFKKPSGSDKIEFIHNVPYTYKWASKKSQSGIHNDDSIEGTTDVLSLDFKEMFSKRGLNFEDFVLSDVYYYIIPRY
ncbi:MAG: hypothetical protein RSC92_05555, partial [Clostridia bacterium]